MSASRRRRRRSRSLGQRFGAYVRSLPRQLVPEVPSLPRRRIVRRRSRTAAERSAARRRRQLDRVLYERKRRVQRSQSGRVRSSSLVSDPLRRRVRKRGWLDGCVRRPDPRKAAQERWRRHYEARGSGSGPRPLPVEKRLNRRFC